LAVAIATSGARGVGPAIERGRTPANLLPINYGTYYALTLPNVTPTAKKPELIAPNSLLMENYFAVPAWKMLTNGKCFRAEMPEPTTGEKTTINFDQEQRPN
jgi:hypothetical protein